MLEDIDPFVKWSPICRALGGCSRRTLYEFVRHRKFPAPDLPASKRGEADLWRASTVRRGIEEFARARAAKSVDTAAAA